MRLTYLTYHVPFQFFWGIIFFFTFLILYCEYKYNVFSFIVVYLNCETFNVLIIIIDYMASMLFNPVLNGVQAKFLVSLMCIKWVTIGNLWMKIVQLQNLIDFYIQLQFKLDVKCMIRC